MFIDSVLEFDVLEQATHTFETKTNVVRSRVGTEQRIPIYSEHRLRVDLGDLLLNKTELTTLISFYNTAKGKTNSFRYRCIADFTLSNTKEVYKTVNQAQAYTQGILVPVDATNQNFRIVKIYGIGFTKATKSIDHPRSGTIKIYDEDQVEILAGFTIDYNTGRVDFTTPQTSDRFVSGEFDYEMRFEQDTLTNNITVVTGEDCTTFYQINNLSLIEVRSKVAPVFGTTNNTKYLYYNNIYAVGVQLVFEFEPFTTFGESFITKLDLDGADFEIRELLEPSHVTDADINKGQFQGNIVRDNEKNYLLTYFLAARGKLGLISLNINGDIDCYRFDSDSISFTLNANFNQELYDIGSNCETRFYDVSALEFVGLRFAEWQLFTNHNTTEATNDGQIRCPTMGDDPTYEAKLQNVLDEINTILNARHSTALTYAFFTTGDAEGNWLRDNNSTEDDYQLIFQTNVELEVDFDGYVNGYPRNKALEPLTRYTDDRTDQVNRATKISRQFYILFNETDLNTPGISTAVIEQIDDAIRESDPYDSLSYRDGTLNTNSEWMQFMVLPYDMTTKSILTALTYSEHLNNGFNSQVVLTLVRCVKITTVDNTVYTFNEGDFDIVVESLTYKAGGLAEPSAVSKKADLSADNINIKALIDTNEISEADLISGRFDSAEILVFIVNWLNIPATIPDDSILLRGYVGDIELTDNTFTLQVDDISSKLLTKATYKSSPTCHYIFGSAECGVNLAPLTYTGAVSFIDPIIEFNRIKINPAEAIIQFEEGVLTFTSGVLNGLSFTVQDNNIVTTVLQIITIYESFPFLPAEMDTITITGGCRKTITDCRFYNNFERFGGIPALGSNWMPGNDRILRGD